MQRVFETEIETIKHTILEMAGLVERCLSDVGDALLENDPELARDIIECDDTIDQYEVLIDRQATEFIAKRQPAASDLRFSIVAIKLGPELERIGDNTVNIARRVLDLAEQPAIKPEVDLPRMLHLARAMVADAIAAYVERDAEAARAIIRRDDEIDSLYMQIFNKLLAFMIDNPEAISGAVDLMFVARYIERIADQATNICEEVVYLVEAKPIRHVKSGGES